jgi:hypothetical protein
VFTVNSRTHDFLGVPPFVNESCVMVWFPDGPGYIPKGVPIQFTFLDPNGISQLGDPNFAFVSPIKVSEIFPTQDVPVGSFVYTFGIGELSIPGRWTMTVTAGSLRYQAATFVVNPIGFTLN